MVKFHILRLITAWKKSWESCCISPYLISLRKRWKWCPTTLPVGNKILLDKGPHLKDANVFAYLEKKSVFVINFLKIIVPCKICWVERKIPLPTQLGITFIWPKKGGQDLVVDIFRTVVNLLLGTLKGCAINAKTNIWVRAFNFKAFRSQLLEAERQKVSGAS